MAATIAGAEQKNCQTITTAFASIKKVNVRKSMAIILKKSSALWTGDRVVARKRGFHKPHHRRLQIATLPGLLNFVV